ncbi:aminotransferase class I/II-fold pyridoxal phosphate-dependent enzyme [Pseudidiomarina halophila]|uniref:aminotransferase class I/II-fold pyridoxal phosphate-dependent enzyme n=1 Tax=Pseudidiomarina halophila TaxID=1449799 RepID=UPI003620BB07
MLGASCCDGYIDDAHGFGVMGEQGRGISANFNQTELAVVSLAFGKACGVAGGAIAVTADVADYLINFCPEFIYSTAMPAAQARAVQAAVDVLQSADGEQLRQRLQGNIEQFKQRCTALQLPIEPSSHAIQTLIVGSDDAAVQQSEALKQRGIWCTAIRPPTVPEGSARLRITLTAAHSSAQIQQLTEALAATQQQR